MFNKHGYAGELGDKLSVYILLIIYVHSFTKYLIIHTSLTEQYVLLHCLSLCMQEKGSQVLIYRQMSRILDILEDYCLLR